MGGNETCGDKQVSGFSVIQDGEGEGDSVMSDRSVVQGVTIDGSYVDRLG